MVLNMMRGIYGQINLPFQGALLNGIDHDPGRCRRAELNCPFGAYCLRATLTFPSERISKWDSSEPGAMPPG